MFSLLDKLKRNFFSSNNTRVAFRITRKKLIALFFLICGTLIVIIYVKSYQTNGKAEVKGASSIKNSPTATRIPSPTTIPSPSLTLTPTPQSPTPTP